MKRLLVSACLSMAFAAPVVAFDGYHLESATTIKGKGEGWDYITLDPVKSALYIGHRSEGLQVFDLKTKKIIKTIANTEGSTGGTLIRDFDLGISNNASGSITPFKLSTGAAKEPIKLGEEIDDSHYDPATKHLAVKMAAAGDTTDVIVLDLPSLKQVGVVKVPSKRIDGSVMDGQGNFYINSRDKNSIFRVDMKKLEVTAEWKIDGCEVPSGLALDAANKRLFAGCRGKGATKPLMAVVDAESGKTVYSHEIGRQNGGVIYDAESRRVFTANGLDGVVVIFEQLGADNYRPVEALSAKLGARTIAFDHKTKKLYSMAAEGSADFSKKINTGVGSFYPNTFFPNTFQVLTFSK